MNELEKELNEYVQNATDKLRSWGVLIVRVGQVEDGTPCVNVVIINEGKKEDELAQIARQCKVLFSMLFIQFLGRATDVIVKYKGVTKKEFDNALVQKYLDSL
jgi:hypothetical protein